MDSHRLFHAWLQAKSMGLFCSVCPSMHRQTVITEQIRGLICESKHRRAYSYEENATSAGVLARLTRTGFTLTQTIRSNPARNKLAQSTLGLTSKRRLSVLGAGGGGGGYISDCVCVCARARACACLCTPDQPLYECACVRVCVCVCR